MKIIKAQFVPLAAAYLVNDVLRDAALLPLWWYTAGLMLVGEWLVNRLRAQEKTVGLTIWLASLFKPMYGQADWQGKIISFILRIFVLIYKLIQMIFWLIFYVAILLLWLFIPPFVIYQLLFQSRIF